MQRPITALTYPQLRARIAHTALEALTRDEIITRLHILGFIPGPGHTTRSLAYKLAWALLPACPVVAVRGR